MQVSAIIPLYNAEKYIAQTLESLLQQSYPLDEIIVVDDCGPDGSAEIVEEYSGKYKSIKLIRQEVNQGGSAARNRGLKEARNEWILFMDADDLIHPDLLKLQVKRLGKSAAVEPSPVAVHPAYVQIDELGKILENSEIRGKQLSFQDTFGSLLVRNYIITPSGLLVNRLKALEIGGYHTNIRIAEDAEFILRLSQQGTLLYVDKPYVYFRRHVTSLTADFTEAKKAGKAILDLYSIEEVKKAILKRNFSEDENLIDLTKLLYQFEMYEEGFQHIQKVKSSQYDISKLYLMSVYHIQKRAYQEAKNLLGKIVDLDNSHGAAINNLGILFALAGDEERAEECFNQSLQLFPGYMDAKHNQTELENGKFDFRFTLRELRPNLLRYN